MAPGASKEITFKISKDKRNIFDDNGEEVLPKGKLTVTIGGASPMPRSKELGAQLSTKSIDIN
ncbi:hypothetical protein NH26_19970 [Flammeovirga pacifica]|uniref:Fibronectin type III-like domain-containing protein n=1 Tax=Flammeovirga pacifica TaxID=915059 RepID=A0A1S1YS82_FLAPC|nr:hypothetical protein NH26_19970 [Flammeovirga pacifica]